MSKIFKTEQSDLTKYNGTEVEIISDHLKEYLLGQNIDPDKPLEVKSDEKFDLDKIVEEDQKKVEKIENTESQEESSNKFSDKGSLDGLLGPGMVNKDTNFQKNSDFDIDKIIDSVKDENN